MLLSWPGLPNYNEIFHVTRNLTACIALFEQLAASGLKRILVAGSCYEYGLQNGPLKEDQPTDPQSCYATPNINNQAFITRQILFAKRANSLKMLEKMSRIALIILIAFII